MSFDPESANAWSKMKDDKGGVYWMVVRTQDDGKVKLVNSGSDGYDAFAACLTSQEPGMFAGVLRVNAVDNRGSVKSIRTKFVRITVVSASMPMVKRARAAQMKPEYENFFRGTHLNLDTDEPARPLNKVDLARGLLKITGAHFPNSYEFFGGGEPKEDDIIPIEGGAAMPPQTAAKKPAAPEPTPAAKPAEKEEESPKKAEEPKKEEAAAPPSPTKPVEVGKMTPAEAWSKVQGDSDPLNWVLLTYDGKDVAGSAAVFAAGAGGLDELKAALDDDHVLFGGVRVTGIDDRGSVKSVRSKMLFIQHTSSNVKPTVRAHAGTARGEFQRILNGTHLNLESPGQLVPKQIEEKLILNGGAHKVGYFLFGPKITKPEQIPAGSGPAQ